MGRKRRWIWCALGIAVLAAGFLLGAKTYQNRFAPVAGEYYEKNVETLDLSNRTLEEISQLQAFPNLKKLDLRGTGLSCADYEQIRAWFPEAEISWDIPFQGKFYAMDTRELNVSALSDEDMAVLGYFTELESVRADDCLDYANLDALRQQRPELELDYRIPVAGEWYDYRTEEMTLPGEGVEELFALIPMLPDLTAVELEAPLAPVNRMLALREAFPQVAFTWHLELAGIPVDEFTETLDLTGIPMTVEQMDAVLPYLLSLNYVDMTDCGISDEEMDALNRRYENIKIVWTTTLGGGFRIRTDETAFIAVKHNYWPSGDDLANLRYCTDMIAIDVGHMSITNCEFVATMPHLRFLILAETKVHDLTPLTGLTELVYLELFITEIDDFSPLVTLTGLEDLNLHYTNGDYKIIAQMSWLKNLWWNNVEHLRLTADQQQELQEAMPDCNFNFTCGSSTGGGWRELPNYYAQRDALGMYYMYG